MIAASKTPQRASARLSAKDSREPANRGESVVPHRFIPRLMAVAVPVLVGVIAFLAFYPALSAGFVNFDDGKLLEQNLGYQGLTSQHLEWMFTTTYMGHYQPLTWLSYAIDFKISGTDPGGYHRTNLILHALNAVLLYFVAMRLLGIAFSNSGGGGSSGSAGASPSHRIASSAGASPSRTHGSAGASPSLGDKTRSSARAEDHGALMMAAAAIGALLFAVHPLRVESVAWVSERRDVLSVFFLLAAALAWLRSIVPGAARLRSLGWYVGSVALLGLSLLAKAWGMSFFVIVTLLNIYPLGRLPWRVRSWLDKACGPVWLQTMPFVVLGLLAALKAGQAQGAAYETMKSLSEWGVADRVAQACYGLVFYLHKTLWPADLAVLYPLPAEMNPLELRFVLSAVFVVAAAVVIWMLRRRVPALVIAGLTYLVVLAPVLGFAQSGPQLVADRYSYVACMSWVIVLAGGLAWLWRRRPTTTACCATGMPALVVIAFLFAATVRQSRVWRDSESLWAHAVAVGADSTIAHRNRGVDLSQAGDVAGAIHHFDVALTLDPTDGSAWYLLADGLKAEGRFDEAEVAYAQAIEHLVQKHLAWQDLGIMYFEDLNRTDDAIRALSEGINYMQNLKTMRPAPAPRLYLYLGMALRSKGDFANARPALEAALKFKSTMQRAEEELQLMGDVP